MTHDNAANALMKSSDVKATVLAAIARIEAVPPGATLIDEISDSDWLDDDVDHWKLEAGSSVSPEGELDECDAEVEGVA